MSIFVLGMHRSGTSALARLISLCGAHHGSVDELMPPKPDNPRGFWERKDVQDLNDRILAAAGGSWDRVRKVDLEAIPAGQRADLEAEISRVLKILERKGTWVLKDPRLCLTFPLWRDQTPRPICVFAIRSPAEVALSLRARDALPLSVGVALWETYLRSAVAATHRLPRFVVEYPELVHWTREDLGGLVGRLEGAGIRGLELPSERRLAEFLSPELVHHRAAEDSELARGLLNCCQVDLLQALQSESWPEVRKVERASAGTESTLDLAETLGRTERNAEDAQQEWAARLEESRVREEETSRKVEKLVRTGQAAQTELDLVAEDLRRAREDAELAKSREQQAREDAQRSGSEVELLETRVEELNRERDSLAEQLAVAEARDSELTRGLDAAREETRRLELELGSAGADYAALSERLMLTERSRLWRAGQVCGSLLRWLGFSSTSEDHSDSTSS